MTSYVRELLDQWRQVSRADTPVPSDTEELPLIDADDAEVVMHREVHFGGSFEVMLPYYEQHKKGAVLDIRHVRHLTLFESKLGQNIAPLSLRASEAEKVAQARALYQSLRDLYEGDKPKSLRLLADLILSEVEEEEAAIQAIVQEGPALVPELAQLLNAPEFLDPLYPGYGLAPALAARCLGELSDEAAIRPLFESLGHLDPETEETVLGALRKLGKPSRDFLLDVVHARPLTPDTERAAAALSSFPSDEKIAHIALKLLGDESLWDHPTLSGYLAICCSGLTTPEDCRRLSALAQEPDFPNEAREEVEYWLNHISPEG